MANIVICADGTWNRPEKDLEKDHVKAKSGQQAGSQEKERCEEKVEKVVNSYAD